jgi:two-component system, sensor histidine kinase LadS
MRLIDNFYRKRPHFLTFCRWFIVLVWCSVQSLARPSELIIDNRSHISLASHATFLRDSRGDKGPDAVAAVPQAQWTRLTQHSLSIGFTRDVVWVRFDALNTTAGGPRLLVLDNVLLTRVQLFERTAAPGWRELPSVAMHSGAPTLHPTFAIEPAVGVPHAYLLRIESTPSLSTTIGVWQPQFWQSRNEKKDFLMGAGYGGYLVLIVLYAAFSAWTRDRMHLAYTLYIAANLVAALLASAWPRTLWPHWPNSFWDSVLGIAVSVPLLLGTWFAVLMLDMHTRWPRASRLLIGLSGAVTVLGVTGSVAGWYVEVMPVVMGYLVLLLLLSMGLATAQAIRGHAAARLFVLAFGLYTVGLLARVLRNLQWLDYHVWIEHLYQAGTFVHMLVMSVGIFTAYSRLKEEAQSARSRLEAEAKLRVEQRDFLTLVSHELRNPMAIISASTDNMARDHSLGDQARNRVHKIQRASGRIQELMEQFLSNERLLQDSHTLQYADHDLRALCKSAAADLPEPALPTLAWRNGTPIALCCDGELVKVAVYNLMVNAWRHAGAQAPIEISTGANHSECWVEVADRGPGIPADEQANLFKRFHRGHQSVDKPGTGLGLYLVKTIAERHGGRVAAHNRKGGGTVFTLTLPLQHSPASVPA